MEARFPSIHERRYIVQQFPFRHVLVYKFVHFACERVDANTLVAALPPA